MNQFINQLFIIINFISTWIFNKYTNIGNIKVKINETEFTYKLSNIHFHLNSEHAINDKLYDIEMYVVHKNINSIDINNIHLVIGYIFEVDNDEDNSFLNSIGFNNGNIVTTVNVQDNVKKENVYYYKGFLTTRFLLKMLIWLLLKILKKCLNHNLINLKNLIITIIKEII